MIMEDITYPGGIQVSEPYSRVKLLMKLSKKIFIQLDIVIEYVNTQVRLP